MKKEIIQQLNKTFEDYTYQEDNIEYWLARDLQKLLDYSEWRNFEKVIEKAKVSCKVSKQEIDNHFVDLNKMV